MTDILERLRKPAPDPLAHGAHEAFCMNERDRHDAADEIERLRKECFALAADQCHDGIAGEYGDHVCREVERLRAELKATQRVVVRQIAELAEWNRAAFGTKVVGPSKA